MPHLKPTALLLSLALLSGCGPDRWAVQNLEEDQATCRAGKQWACDRLAHDQVLLEQSSQQRTDAAGKVALGLLLLPVLALAVVAEAQQPQYVVVARCRGWGCW